MKNPNLTGIRNDIESPAERALSLLCDARDGARAAWRAWRRYLIDAVWDDCLIVALFLGAVTWPLLGGVMVRPPRAKRRGETTEQAAPSAGQAMGQADGVAAWQWDAERKMFKRPRLTVEYRRPGPAN